KDGGWGVWRWGGRVLGTKARALGFLVGAGGGVRASFLGRRGWPDAAPVGKKRGPPRYPPQGRLRPRAPCRLEHPPALERRQQPRRDLRILGIERQHRVHDEVVASAVGAVELLLVRQRKRVDQGAYAIGIGKREGGMVGERLDAVERRGFRNSGLQREPLVDDQRIVGIAGVKIVERGGALGHVAQRQRRERGHAVGHVVGRPVLPRGEHDGVCP